MSITTIDTGVVGMRASDAELTAHKLLSNDTPDVVRRLRATLDDYSRRRACRAGWTRRFIPTQLPSLDAVLPHGGLPCGAVTEILSDGPGVGAMSLAMHIAGRCLPCRWHGQATARPWVQSRNTAKSRRTSGPCHPIEPDHRLETGAPWEDRRCIVLIDTHGDFYPPAVCRHGIALDRLIIVRAANEKDVFWAVDQSLRCVAVAVVIASLRHPEERLSRRLQLAAESSGCIGLVLRPVHRGVKSFAALQMLVESVPDSDRRCLPGRSLSGDPCLSRVTLLKVREGMPTGPLLVDLQHETSALPVHPVPVDRSTAKLA
ncbi:MAG: hypothetical protein JSU86_11450 [Phycisphaerales bacterium]|nr:MAG: hypothetical protein JSU86_11450 [Phycisphaerales bacterium]